MSKLNDIHSSYGKSFGMAIANTYSYNVVNAIELPKNMVIIAAPNDNGQHSMLVTDNDGTPIRLTYDIVTGNGLVDNNGSLSLEVDNTTFFENTNKELSINVSSLVDNTTIQVASDKMNVSTQNMPKASKSSFGVVKVDGSTILSDNGRIYANTSKLDFANNKAGIYGIIKPNNAILATNGVLSINNDIIDKATNSSFGVVKPDNTSIVSNNGILSVSINSFRIASSTYYGISKPDDDSIYKTNQNSLKINYNALKRASENSFGLVKPDNNSTIVTNGVLGVKNYSVMQQTILELDSTINDLDNRLKAIEDELNILVPITNGPRIFTFVCDGLASVDLHKPEEYGEMPDQMPVQKINASFIVNTNCPFKIAIRYIDNESPQIALFEINYNDVDRYPGETGLTRTYQSTNEKDVKISFSWLCKNYRDTDNSNYSIKTRVVIDVMYANDITITKEVKYSIVRFNSLYNEDLISNDDEEVLVGIGGNIIPIVEYQIKLANDIAGIEYINDSYYLPESNAKLYEKSYTETSRQDVNAATLPPSLTTSNDNLIEIVGNSSYTFNSQIPIELWIKQSDSGEFIYYRDLATTDIKNIKTTFSYSYSYTYIDEEDQNATGTGIAYATNVSLGIDGTQSIIMSYTFK